MPERYAYLLGGLIVCLSLAVCLVIRRDLAKKAALIGLLAFPACLSDLIFTRDYWHPPALFGSPRYSLEDIIFSFSIIALVVVLYPTIRRMKFTDPVRKPHLITYLGFVVLTIVALLGLSVWLGMNSVIVSTLTLVVFTGVMWYLRPDLIRPSITTGVILAIMVIPLYALLFDVLAPHWWEHYWYLWHTNIGRMIFGHVPLTEIAWYFAWGVFGSISLPFVEGRELQPLSNSSK